jgi:hypothetical protein
MTIFLTRSQLGHRAKLVAMALRGGATNCDGWVLVRVLKPIKHLSCTWEAGDVVVLCEGDDYLHVLCTRSQLPVKISKVYLEHFQSLEKPLFSVSPR